MSEFMCVHVLVCVCVMCLCLVSVCLSVGWSAVGQSVCVSVCHSVTLSVLLSVCFVLCCCPPLRLLRVFRFGGFVRCYVLRFYFNIECIFLC